MATAPDSLTAQRKALPDSPGVYLFKDARGKVIYVGKAASIRKRVAGHFSKPGGARGSRDMVAQIAEVDFIATETEAEALLAEQRFIRQHRPLFNVRLRDDKSYPYIGISLDEDFPRVYFTRERHRRSRAYFGPFSNAKRVRETLDLLGKVFQHRTCDGPEPGRASRQPLPRLLHQALPGALRRLHLEGGLPREHRHDHRLPLGPLPPDRARPRAGDEARPRRSRSSRRRRTCRNRLKAVRSLLERQRISNEAVGTLDAIAVAAEDTDANAQVFQVRDGVLADRQSFYLENAARRDEAEVAEEFVLQYYATALAGPAAGDRAARRSRDTETLGEALTRAPQARRSRCATPSAATSAASSSWPSATRAWRSTRTGCARSAAAASASRRSTASSSALGMDVDPDAHRVLRHLQPDGRRTRSRRWSCSRAARRRSPTTAASGSGGSGAGRLRGDGRGALAAHGPVRRAARALAARQGVTTRASPRCRR